MPSFELDRLRFVSTGLGQPLGRPPSAASGREVPARPGAPALACLRGGAAGARASRRRGPVVLGRARTVAPEVRLSSSVLSAFGVGRFTGYRALKALERAGFLRRPLGLPRPSTPAHRPADHQQPDCRDPAAGHPHGDPQPSRAQ